jgi:predicted MFS family arabinose efflux permease
MRIFAIFAAGYFLSYAFRSIGALIGSDLARDLALNPRQLGFLASAYFLAFCAAQPAIGIAMDRFGPVRVNACLTAIAACGAAIFAAATDLATLTVGRALVGLGMAGALMTAFKAFVIWYEPRHREALSGGMMAIGGLAAMVTATPAELLMRTVGWRGLFWVLCMMSVLVTLALMFALPASRPGDTRVASTATDGGFGRIFASRIFLSYAPLAFFGSGGFSAIQSLWAGPWLSEVAGLSRAAGARVLSVYGLALFSGYLLIGLTGARIQRQPGAARRWYVISLAVAYAALGAIIFNAWPYSSLPWFVYGVTLGAGMLAYPALTRAFPVSISGRVLTAYNTLMFLGGFVLQSAIGVMIQHLLESGWDRVAAYQAAFGALLATQALALAWFTALSRET